MNIKKLLFYILSHTPARCNNCGKGRLCQLLSHHTIIKNSENLNEKEIIKLEWLCDNCLKQKDVINE